MKMRRLGLIGGTSWHSTIEYYRNINRDVNAHFGDNTNPPLVLFNMNQAMIHQHQREGDWAAIADLAIDAGEQLQNAGVEAVMFCANTPHKVFDDVQAALSVPILHIADATADAILAQGIEKVCFIGTRFTMEQPFLVKRIARQGLQVLVPAESSTIDQLHRIIQQELTFGKVESDSKRFVTDAITAMVDRGAAGVVLGCTEFPLMFHENDFEIPIFNTTTIHSQMAVDFILENVST